MFKVHYDLNVRRDLLVISQLVQPGHRVLDLGCGNGAFLRYLRDERHASVLGIELDSESVAQCIGNGVPVVQRNLDEKLDFAEDRSFDLVILSQTLQEMHRPDRLLKEIIRVGHRAAVSVINFGHFSCRLQLLFSGEMPRTPQIPYHWYDTPNIHLGTISDFRKLCARLDLKIEQEIPIPARFPKLSRIYPNWFAVGCVFVISGEK